MEKLKQVLKEKGFSFYLNHGDDDNLIQWYAAKRIQSNRDCELNQHAPSICVMPTHYRFSDGRDYVNARIEVIGQFKGVWWHLSAYSLLPEEAVQRLDEITETLTRLWETL